MLPKIVSIRNPATYLLKQFFFFRKQGKDSTNQQEVDIADI
jgi:hypothetical protein